MCQDHENSKENIDRPLYNHFNFACEDPDIYPLPGPVIDNNQDTSSPDPHQSDEGRGINRLGFPNSLYLRGSVELQGFFNHRY